MESVPLTSNYLIIPKGDHSNKHVQDEDIINFKFNNYGAQSNFM